jgi:teichuronic acid biosynthesis glycosyltransferase TuaG
MKQDLKVSVLMPAYNADKYISKSIESVLCQTYSNLEVIVVNDGSTDNTESVVLDYMKKDPRIKYFRQENGRQGKARNAAMKLASGELIALLDSDDLWDIGKTELQIKKMREENVDFIFSNARIHYHDPTPSKQHGKLIHDLSGGMAAGKYTGKEMFSLLVESNRIVTQTAMFKRECMEKSGGFEEELKYQNCEDYELWLRMAYAGFSFYGMKEILATYRRHNQNSTGEVISQLRPEIQVINKLYDKGMISEKQRDKTISWLTRVLCLALYNAGKYSDLKNLINRKNDISHLPGGKLYYIRFLLKDVILTGIKKPIKKLIGR